MKRFGKGMLRTLRSMDWFDYFLLSVYVFFGVVGGMVATMLGREFS